jgi:hypothetical protein
VRASIKKWRIANWGRVLEYKARRWHEETNESRDTVEVAMKIYRARRFLKELTRNGT